ncbi:MAG TPA: carbohydrate-binding domain-containing protein [Bacillota bacterium]|nr:carbohydrate-binding domain-containing protein [Bacillota bacterium]
MKKIISVLLCMLLCVWTLASCGNEASSGTSTTTSSGSTETSYGDVSMPSSTISGGISIPDDPVASTSSTASEDESVEASETASEDATSEDATSEDSTDGVDSDTVITLKGSTAMVSGGGASVSGSIVTVYNAGTYYVSGTMTGRIVVNSSDAENVKLIFDGVKITSDDGPAIYVASAEKLIIELAEGSVNILSDADEYTVTLSDGEPDACLFSKDDLKIKGSGTLYITGNYAKGIHSKDDLQIVGATIYVVAEDDGIRGKDSVQISSGSYIVISAGVDGIRTNNETDEGKGYIEIEGGYIEVEAALDAIQAVTDVYISGGTFVLTSGSGSSSSSTSSRYTTTSATESTKAIKTAATLSISDGVFTIDSADDALHSDGTITISGGVFAISSGDDGMHAETTLTISGEKITISKSYEGLEAATINIQGGTIDLTASDDGLNATDGTSEMGGMGGGMGGGRGGMGGGSSSSSNCLINITGGVITVNAGGDGVDSNGSITMSGGSCVVFGPTDNGNGALDYNNTFVITGGSMVAFGSTGMAQGSSSGSTQACLFVGITASANTTLKVTGDSKTIIEITSPKKYGCVFISTPDVISGDEYTFYLGGEELGSTNAS